LAAIISGNLLMQMAPSWNILKYFAFTHLSLTDYLAGKPMMMEDMSFPFSLFILSIWALAALFISWITFVQKDILS
jgi:ABC-2 type transport system permease protein